MPAAPSVTICPPLETLDDLELLRSGASRADDHPIHITPPPGLEPHDLVDVVDPEGVPLLRMSAPDPASDLVVDGQPEWLSRLSPRPFEHLYLPPERARAAATGHAVLLVDRPITDDDLTAYAGRPVLLLVLGGPSVDPDAHTLETIRSATLVAARRAETSVVALPLSAARAATDPALATDVLRAYAEASPDRLPAGSAGTGDTRGDGLVLFFTGLSGSGKSTVARAVRNTILEQVGRPITMLDGDVVRRHLSAGLGFSPQDRETNIRRIGWVAAQIAHHGGLAICSPIAPYDATRKAVREMVHDRGGRFVLVHISTPVEACERRDRKGLYAKARAGEITDFTGISAPYEEPDDADLALDTSTMSVDEARDRVLALLDSTALLHARA